MKKGTVGKGGIVALAGVVAILGATGTAFGRDRVAVNGDFTADVDFATLTLTPVGANCLLEVEAELEFTGTLVGIATGTTRALVLAPCQAVGVNPPGTFKDVFRANLEFLGTLAEEPVIADLAYRGITEVGGTIKALFHLSDGLKGVLKVDAIVAVDGSYQGSVFAD